jgi:hypothetical protein
VLAFFITSFDNVELVLHILTSQIVLTDLIFQKRKLSLKLTTYEILSTGSNCGIVEFIPDAFSIDYIKK